MRIRVPSAFRYPGSKEKIAADIIRHFPCSVTHAFQNQDLSTYCEPFIGCGAMAVKILPSLNKSTRVIFSDKDFGIVSLWKIVVSRPDELVTKLMTFVPSVDAFNRFKEQDGNISDPLEAAFQKFALHQMSFSGLGVKAGGPIGGQKQRSDYAVDCRYRPERHAKHLIAQHKLLKRFNRVDVIHGDFSEALAQVPADGFAYLDPPYYLKGGELYKHNMDDDDHRRLADILKFADYQWVLSYDDHERVRDLYDSWADTNSFEMTATIDTKKGSKSRRKNSELVISKREGC